MNLKEILETGANVTLAITANDLKEWHKEVITDTKRELEQAVIADKAESYISAKQVSQMLDIDLSTLWRWEKRGYLVSAKIGGKRRYKYSEVKSILEGGHK